MCTSSKTSYQYQPCNDVLRIIHNQNQTLIHVPCTHNLYRELSKKLLRWSHGHRTSANQNNLLVAFWYNLDIQSFHIKIILAQFTHFLQSSPLIYCVAPTRRRPGGLSGHYCHKNVNKETVKSLSVWGNIHVNNTLYSLQNIIPTTYVNRTCITAYRV